MAITLSSFENTPQAQDDLFTGASTGLTEDNLSPVHLDVMGNDLGGNAKVLYSIDDGTGSSTDLLSQDTARAEAVSQDYSANGAHIWITAGGKVGYDASTFSAAIKAQLNQLQVSQYFYDTFTYAIRMANGTLSWATATIQFVGANDAPVVSGPVTGSASEDGATSTLDALANASDVDDNTTLSVVNLPTMLPAGVSFDAASHSFTLDPSVPTYPPLAAGETTQVTVSYGVSDGLATTPASVTWTVTGTNDAPVVSGPVSGSPVPPVAGQFTVADATTNQTTTGAGTPYSGPVAGLTSQFICPTTDQVTVTALIPNVFIQVGMQGQINPLIAGINVSAANGNNVLDSYANSSFLTDGSGIDQNYIDARGATQNSWSTVVNFHAGDNVTVWGVTPQDFTLQWIGDTYGAAGATGLTGVCTSNSGEHDIGITLAGFTSADLNNGKLAISWGATQSQNGVPGASYLDIAAT